MDLTKLDPTKQALSLFEEFKTFAFKGNVIDLAVGVIVGGAFSNIVKSLVDNIIMPVLGAILPGSKGYEDWTASIQGKPIHYGKFLGDSVNFLILAAALFVFIFKFLGWVLRSKTEEPAPLSKDQQLLSEIRDLLKSREQGGCQA
ncbi:large conductance mechanosensitive channel protein MscL [Singulisphaera rosea]